MNGHPAIAYLIAEHMLEERRREARSHHRAVSATRARSIRLGRYQITITKEAVGVPRAM
jgi:hypothetical protein